MGALLSKLAGLNPMILYAALAAAAAIVAGGGWTVWYLTSLGKEAAIAECDRRARAAETRAHELETVNREMNREVIIRHVTGEVRLGPVVEKKKDEVKRDEQANPAPAGCELSAEQLRDWNLDPDDADMPLRQGAPRGDPSEPSRGDGRGPRDAAAEQLGSEGSLQARAQPAPGSGSGGEELHGRAGG